MESKQQTHEWKEKVCCMRYCCIKDLYHRQRVGVEHFQREVAFSDHDWDSAFLLESQQALVDWHVVTHVLVCLDDGGFTVLLQVSCEQ